MTLYTYYHSPRGIAHLSHNHRYTLCGHSIREGWVESTATTSHNCTICRRIELAEAATRRPTSQPPHEADQ